MTSDGSRLEAAVLAELAAEAGAGSCPRLASIAAEARAVVDQANLNESAAERELDRISVSLRRAILQRAHDCADAHFRSPAHGVPKPLPSGLEVTHSYERAATAEHLEQRVAQNSATVAGWRSEHVVFSSAVAAMSVVLQCYRAMLQPALATNIRVATWSSYFETGMQLELFRSQALVAEEVGDLPSAVASGNYHAILVEPVRYDWDLSVMDISAFVRAWRSAESRPRTLIVDTTLPSFTWPTRQFLQALPDGRPNLVVEVRSGLKLDQQGLELGNAGVVSVYSCHENQGTPNAAEFAAYLRMARTLSGAAMLMDCLAALDASFVFDAQWTARHAGQVFLHNAMLAGALADRPGLFERIGHPSLHGNGPLRHGPFVVCQLADDTIENHGLLLAVINEEVRRRDLLFAWGSSFGFRSHRYETILPRVKDRKGLFKVAMGAREGPSLHAVIDLMCHVASYPDFEALGRDYPGVEPVDLMAMSGVDAGVRV